MIFTVSEFSYLKQIYQDDYLCIQNGFFIKLKLTLNNKIIKKGLSQTLYNMIKILSSKYFIKSMIHTEIAGIAFSNNTIYIPLDILAFHTPHNNINYFRPTIQKVLIDPKYNTLILYIDFTSTFEILEQILCGIKNISHLD
jgi:hypothetical protein